MTWGLMYVLHGLAGVGLIALVMMHVYMGLRPEKLPITKSMIFGWMDRDFYLKSMIPSDGWSRHLLRHRYPVEWKAGGLTDAG
jgi:cytochrome b subunit of formate dehydrogenase